MQATITLIDKEGNVYPVGGCCFFEKHCSEGESIIQLKAVSPSGEREWVIEESGRRYDAKPTSPMLWIRDQIGKALAKAALPDPQVTVFDLREV